MAALTMQATVDAAGDRSTTVVKSTTDTIGSATAALIFDNTVVDRYEIMKAADALLRALHREFSKVSTPAGVPTSGSSVE